MKYRNIVLLGKGELAIKVADYLRKNFDSTIYIVPDMPEPEWSDSLLAWSLSENVNVIPSGKYKDIPNVPIDLAISVFYGSIIKKDFIDRCKMIINLHNSPLPKYRGVRPINWALKNNEQEHGVTIHRITENIDDGPILGQVKYSIYPEIEEVEDVYKRGLKYGWELFLDVIKDLDYKYDNARPQNEQEASYYSMKRVEELGNRKGFKR